MEISEMSSIFFAMFFEVQARIFIQLIISQENFEWNKFNSGLFLFAFILFI